MSHNQRRDSTAGAAVQTVDVAATDAARLHLDQDVLGSYLRPGHVFEVFNGGGKVRDVGKSDEFRRDWKSQRFWSQETWFGDYRTKGWAREGVPGPDFPPHARAGKKAGAVVLPYERAGTLMVFRAFNGVSYALIMSATRPMFLLYAVRPPRA